MSEYTPTTEEIRENYARSLLWPAQSDPARAAFFDRWLAAHDAEVREHARHEFCDPRLGCVVAEEPEWEYGVIAPTGRMVNNGDYTIQQTHRRRKAGPWVPVES